MLCVHESGGLDQRHSRNVQAVKLLSYSGTSPWLGAVRMTGKRQRVAARKDVLHSAACRAYELKYARKKVCVCVCVCVCVFVCVRARHCCFNNFWYKKKPLAHAIKLQAKSYCKRQSSISSSSPNSEAQLPRLNTNVRLLTNRANTHLQTQPQPQLPRHPPTDVSPCASCCCGPSCGHGQN